ncbi:hypothetical protein [Albimonas pacifica]|uniref:MetA-pathway of phenol degradation n=1 Tax=Albimonas pacifica TaxID=1114924 RepID=A0A1I3BQA1_9RHOB|nr:hypothetical protein [Albimonas pacifica]SFH64465.1 hypothetical protein SAMN05216258_101263 [Albimonas pacifica]
MLACFDPVSAMAQSAGAPSSDQVARELANPNNALASLTFKNQVTGYTGDLPGADDQANYTLLFQPIFPFPLGERANGGAATLFIRPAFPILLDQPVFDVAKGGFGGVDALGDIGFDIGYGVTEKSGLLWAVGAVGTLPTATDDRVGGEQLRLGPEALLARFEDWGVYGVFPKHQWAVAGDSYDYSASQVQFFLKFLPGDGWNVGTQPTMTYDWKAEDWTVPLNLTVSKTVILAGTPVKLELAADYYVAQPGAFGPEWTISFNITPVVPNFILGWLK